MPPRIGVKLKPPPLSWRVRIWWTPLARRLSRVRSVLRTVMPRIPKA